METRRRFFFGEKSILLIVIPPQLSSASTRWRSSVAAHLPQLQPLRHRLQTLLARALHRQRALDHVTVQQADPRHKVVLAQHVVAPRAPQHQPERHGWSVGGGGGGQRSRRGAVRRSKSRSREQEEGRGGEGCGGVAVCGRAL